MQNILIFYCPHNFDNQSNSISTIPNFSRAALIFLTFTLAQQIKLTLNTIQEDSKKKQIVIGIEIIEFKIKNHNAALQEASNTTESIASRKVETLDAKVEDRRL